MISNPAIEDLLTNVDSDVEISKPIYAINFKDEKDLAEWLNCEFKRLSDVYDPYFREMFRNVKHHSMSTDLHTRTRRAANSNALHGAKRSTFQINDAQDIIETRVSRNNRIKPKIDILPGNPNDPGDVSAAKEVEHLKNHLFYINNIDSLKTRVDRLRYLCGQSYVGIEWNPHKGDLHPDYVAAKENGEIVEFVNSDGEAVVTRDGKRVELDNVRIGDVEVERKLPWHILPEYADSWENVEYYFEIKKKPLEQLKREYPNKKKEIEEFTAETQKACDNRTISDIHSIRDGGYAHEIVFFHKKTRFVPEGLKVSFLSDLILEKGELPYSHGKLPLVRLSDLALEGTPISIATYSHIIPIQKQKNNLDRMALKNVFLGANPKLVVSAGTNLKQINNEHSVIQVNPGAEMMPQLLTPNPISPQVIELGQMCLDAMNRVGSTTVARGDMPPGVTAAVAMDFMHEQEVIRESDSIAKLDEFEVELARLIIAVAGEYYEADDERMMRIMGNNGLYSIKRLDTANLNKSYDIRVQKGVSVPDSKAARRARVERMMEMMPNAYTMNEWAHKLGTSSDRNAIDLPALAVSLAEEESEMILRGDGEAAVESYHDHFHHWRLHYARMQSPAYKAYPEEFRLEHEAHIHDHEYEMMQLAEKNPLFQQKISQLDAFPLFYNAPFTPASKEHQEAVVQGKSNRGEPLAPNEQIPTSIENEENINLNKGEGNL